MDKIKKKILLCLRDYFLANALPLKVIDISERLDLDGSDTLVNVQILETGGYVLKKNELPGRPLYDDYIITDLGIQALKMPYKKIVLAAIPVLGAIASVLAIVSYFS